MESIIRPMKQSDIDSVYAIETATHRAPWSRDILSDCVLVGYDCRVFELSDNNVKQIVGYMICRNSQSICHILNLCISAQNQNKGYGKSLLKSVLDTLEANPKITSVVLEVRPSNTAALALYKKFGFQQDSIKEDYYIDGQGTEDAILLKKVLI
ncbi:ribosomal-protein-alanine N-acetyltransferase [Legionella massiliensis]|uniref:[Ribosomal protein bS18]-alanine N-acetyltransferase n=1 Tax=Legionella massiliensis TaxID=1034943 RepID=A0A078L1L6_9GAMM|nr:ribosomal protein S18-alanine N-acetyltransferase [Legionella massiliensis]CDZ79147.1 ribosomal-protein-alanine N-acetyltransferase [Legionella massiliensis]CEE14885.1 putative N-acetyltransferase YvbK [Legionella massiliensis]